MKNTIVYIKLKIEVSGEDYIDNESIENMINEMEYSLTSNDETIEIVNTEITDIYFHNEE